MVITFRTDVPISETMMFEDCYEPELAASLEDKQKTIENGLAFWMFVDGKMAGEVYSVEPMAMIGLDGEDEGPPTPDEFVNSKTLYVYSVTLLPEFRGKGLSEILLAYALGIYSIRYDHVIWHATSDAMLGLSKKFGAVVTDKYENWYDTGRTAWFCSINLR